MTTSSLITPLHVERGRQMRSVVLHDVAHRGLSFEGAVESLAGFLGVDVETVRLAVAIANDADEGSPRSASLIPCVSFAQAAYEAEGRRS